MADNEENQIASPVPAAGQVMDVQPPKATEVPVAEAAVEPAPEATISEEMPPAQPPEETPTETPATTGEGTDQPASGDPAAPPDEKSPLAIHGKEQPPKHGPQRPVVSIVIALLVATLLSAAAIFVYVKTQDGGTDKAGPAANQQPAETEAAPQDVDQATQEIDDTLNQADDDAELSEDDLSDESLGL
jgi:hypothetical protein